MPLPQTNLHAHFTAKQGTTIVSDGLDQWEDQVGSGSADAPTASERPSMIAETLNGVAVPYFVTDDVLDMTAFSGGQVTNLTSNGVITIAAVIKGPHGQSNGYVWDGSNGENRLTLRFNDTNFVVRQGSNQVFRPVQDDVWFRIIVKHIEGGNSEIYVDGSLDHNTSDVGISGMDGVTFGQREDGFGHGEFTIAEWVIYDGDADEAAIDSYFVDEWFGITLTADQGSYTVTGQTVNFSKRKSISLDQGSYDYSNSTVETFIDHIIIPDQGNYLLTGQDVVFNEQATAIVLNQGSYTVTGNNVNIFTRKTVDINSGIYTVTGNPTFIRKLEVISLDSGNYLLTGNEVGFVPLNTDVTFPTDRTFIIDIDKRIYYI